MLLVLHVLAFDFTSKLDIGFGIICVASFESFTLLLEVFNDTEFTRLLARAFLRERLTMVHWIRISLLCVILFGNKTDAIVLTVNSCAALCRICFVFEYIAIR